MSSETIVISPVTRFSDRVDNYIRYRPSYPKELITFLETELAIQKDSRIADIGSGTGLFAELFLQKGYSVVCIEPNSAMRIASEKKLKHYPGFDCRHHQAEQTSLRTNSVDLITAATSFHWMEPVATKKEFNRILKKDGHIVLAWNIRKRNTPFLTSYQQLREQFSTESLHNEVNEEILSSFFEPCSMKMRSFPNVQYLDFDGLKGQLLSSSSIPLPGHQSYDTMISSLIQLFVAYNRNGFVEMEYETKVYWNE